LSFYFGTFPHAADPARHLVVPFNVHGVDHYISPKFMMLFKIVATACASSLLALAIAKVFESGNGPKL